MRRRAARVAVLRLALERVRAGADGAAAVLQDVRTQSVQVRKRLKVKIKFYCQIKIFKFLTIDILYLIFINMYDDKYICVVNLDLKLNLKRKTGKP